MKIVNDYWISYGDACVGDTFKYMGNYYMKVRLDYHSSFQYAAINLETGISTEICDDEFIEPIAAEIHVGA